MSSFGTPQTGQPDPRITGVIRRINLRINGNGGQRYKTVKMPSRSKVIKVTGEGMDVILYTLDDITDDIAVNREFEVYGVGDYFNPDNLKYLDSVWVHNSYRHVFERLN
jgi:hypothetical protein